MDGRSHKNMGLMVKKFPRAVGSGKIVPAVNFKGAYPIPILKVGTSINACDRDAVTIVRMMARQIER